MADTIVATVRQTLDRIERENPTLNAFVRVSSASAPKEAEQADRSGAAERQSHLLHGMPIAVKDIIDVAGEPTGCGSLTRKGSAPAAKDAHVVAKLRAAGAVIVGKTHTVEYAFGGYGTNVTVGTPRNPWDRKVHRVPGGSSSGSGAAVGAGLVPGALGTDTGGSVRIPAALCGCVGLKTSIGTVGRTGVAPLSGKLDSVGPLAKDVRTAALMFAAIMGPDSGDRTTAHERHFRPGDVLDGLEHGIRGLRLGRLDDRELPLASEEALADYHAALSRLEDAGARVTSSKLPERLDTYVGRVGKMVAVEGYGLYKHFAEDPKSGLAEPVRERMLSGKGASPADVEAHDMRWRKEVSEVEAIFDGVDAIVLPTIPFAAMPLSEVDENKAPYPTHTRWVNYLELAALAVPTSLSKAGLPLSLQIVVRRFHDPLALRIGRAFEAARGAFPAPPA